MDSTQTSNNNHNNNNNNYNINQSNGVVCEGWLTKSPPEKVWKTKWRRRWFVLRLSGQIPGQYVLEYYADSTKRKLKGAIDLDQCEQVDAGLQLESRKENFQFMFDVRTSKRTFYLVAKSETEMNKWVECICSVCGLKIHVEEGQDDRYSPQPMQESVVSANNNNNSGNNSSPSVSSSSKTVSSTTITSVPTSSSTLSSNSSTNTLVTTLTRNKNSEPINNSTNHSKNSSKNSAKSISRNDSKTSNGRAVTHIEGPSGPYIPISECRTGPPINDSTDLDAVPLPSKGSHAVSDECYDIPRQLNPHSDPMETNKEISDNLLNCVPKPPQSVSTLNKNSRLRKSVDAVVGPPKPNWDTYPGDSTDSHPFNSNDVNRTSVRSCNAIDATARDSGIDTQRSSSPLSNDFNRDSVQSTDGTGQAPPRPPKPASFNTKKPYKQPGSCTSLPSAQLYDVPITAVEHNLKPDNDSPTLSTISRPPAYSTSDCSPKSPDELYDFPRVMNTVSETQSVDGTELINATVPIGFQDRSTRRSDSNKHSYTNAPPGYFTNKETVFNYEYRPTLTSGAEDTNAFITNNDLAQADRSPLTPNSANYNNFPISSSLPNSQSFGPPAVNRDLKPRRKGSDSDASNTALPSPTMKTAAIQLQPPPALTRIHSAPTKRSFRKPGTSGQSHVTLNGNPPRIPSRPGQYYHNREASTSEDDVSHNGNGSRRNSSNDDPQQSKGSVVPPPRPRPYDGSEIQYLDLDLDSDSNSQSPRTPNEHIHQRTGSTLSNKEVTTNTSQPQTQSSASTVYKTVDFLKTEAFNKMRLNVENYRNSQ